MKPIKLISLTNFLLLSLLIGCSTPPATPVPTQTKVVTPTPSFDGSKFGSVELDVTYCTVDGKAQKLDVYYPKSGGPWPVLVYVHGGSWREGDKAEGAGWRNMNDLGYLVVAVNYRMAAEKKFPVMIEDVKCAVRYLRAHSAEYNLDADHIGAIGASAGGHLVALLGTADKSAGWEVGEYLDQTSSVQAVVSMAGLSDFTVEMPDGIDMAIYYAFGSLTGPGSAKMVAASPVTYISADDPPFLLIHGDKDGVVPVEQSKILNDKLLEAGLSSSLVIVQNGDHSLQGTDTTPPQEEIYKTIVDFLEENLK